MRRIQPLSIYPPPGLRSRLETLADSRGRSLNKQIIRLLERVVAQIEKRQVTSGARSNQ